MLCRRGLVQTGAVAAAGVLLGTAVPVRGMRNGMAAEMPEMSGSSGAAPAQSPAQVSVDAYGTQTLVGPSGVRYVYPTVIWIDLQTFDQVEMPRYSVNLFDEAFPQGWTYRYEAAPLTADAQDAVLQIFDEGASEPMLYACLTDPAAPTVPVEGAQVVFTGDYADENGQVAVLACAPDEVPAIQDWLAQGLLYAAAGPRDARRGAYAVRGDEGVRIFTPYYVVSLEQAPLEPGWGFMLVENPAPEDGDTSTGFHRLMVLLGENGPVFGIQCFDTPEAQADQAYGRVPVEGVVSSDGKLIAVVPEGDAPADWVEQAPTYASWVQTAPANSWDDDDQYLRAVPGDDGTLVETPYYAVRFPLEGAWEFSYSDDATRLLSHADRAVVHSLIALRTDGDDFPSWMQFFCQPGRGSEVWDGPLAFALSDVTTSDGLTVGVAVGMPDPANPRPEDPDYDGVLALAQQYAQCIEPLPADAAVPQVKEVLLREPLVLRSGAA